MKTTNKLFKILTTITLIFTIGACGYAQDAQKPVIPAKPIIVLPTDDEIKEQEKLLTELNFLRAKTKSLEEQVKLLTISIDAYKQVEEVRTKQNDFLKQALEDSIKYGDLSEKKESLYKSEIDSYKNQVASLEKEVNDLKKSKFKNKILQGLSFAIMVYLATK